MRGKGLPSSFRKTHIGITPACAGKSAIVWRFGCHFQDHPRVCGEKHNRSYQQGLERGSPPRMRGKALPKPCVPRRVRITPAHAGKSSDRMITVADDKDHPRTCGEKCQELDIGFRVRGSPPHMRGKADHPEKRCPHQGITPAHAGKSYIRPA